MSKSKKCFITSGILFIAFIVFTYAVTVCDVQPIGPQNSKVGLATINKAVADALQYNDLCYKLSEVMGYIAISTVIIFGLFGLMQLFIKKGFKNVDKDLYALLGLYVVVLGIYVLFENVIINYRPIIIEGELEASYPSSHTMLSIAFLSAAILQFSARLKKKSTRLIVISICAIDGIGMILCRILAGVHWISDILAGVIIALACFMLYMGIFINITEKKKQRHQEMP